MNSFRWLVLFYIGVVGFFTLALISGFALFSQSIPWRYISVMGYVGVMLGILIALIVKDKW
jgi:hypothetical protein